MVVPAIRIKPPTRPRSYVQIFEDFNENILSPLTADTADGSGAAGDGGGDGGVRVQTASLRDTATIGWTVRLSSWTSGTKTRQRDRKKILGLLVALAVEVVAEI